MVRKCRTMSTIVRNSLTSEACWSATVSNPIFERIDSALHENLWKSERGNNEQEHGQYEAIVRVTNKRSPRRKIKNARNSSSTERLTWTNITTGRTRNRKFTSDEPWTIRDNNNRAKNKIRSPGTTPTHRRTNLQHWRHSEGSWRSDRLPQKHLKEVYDRPEGLRQL